ncbi:PDDEXK family nuclease [Natronobiforma cellulositropha]|uniref:hypothetical protein n=1 Tax=Natronobiforma cellulositropha TaxID=1679076 RepID=UPI0021D5AE6F|nr:hypothetical protein [Natronobiforma cellulositropha]
MRIKEFDQKTSSTSATYEHRPVRDELQLESWLHQNADLLLDEQLLIIGRQFSVETGTPDLVGLDKYGNVVVFELKAGKSGSNSATEKSILGQPQSYSRAISSLEYDDLDDAYREYRLEVEDGKWEGIQVPPSDDSLKSIFERWFGRSIPLEQFNTNQRMVIVAEHITRTTEQNVRHLVQEGLPMQCVEVQRVVHPDADSKAVLAAETVVDYSLQRVKPAHESTEEFEALLVNVRERIRAALNEKSIPTPSDYVTKTPRNYLDFTDKTLMEDLNIAYTIKPYADGYVTLSINLNHYGDEGEQEDKDRVRSLIRNDTEILNDETLSFGPQPSTVVQRRLPLRTEAGDVTTESVSEIVDGFIGLIERTYPVFVNALQETSRIEK